MMYLTKITKLSQFHEFQNQWDNLLSSRKPAPLPLTHGWAAAWWKEFNHNKTLCIFCIYDAEKLIAIAPFYEEKSTYRGIPVQQLHLLSDGHSPYSDLIYDSALTVEKIIQALKLIFKESKNDLIIFSKLPKTSPTYACLVSHAITSNYNTVIKDNLITPSINISGEWQTFFKQRSRKFHKSIHNKLNRFKKEPDFKISCESITSVDNPVLNEIIKISKKSWKASIKSDLGSDTTGKKFLFDLVETFGANKHIQIWILRKKTIPVAYEFHVIFNSIVYPIRADYDNEYKKYSPGSILEYTLLKHLFDEQQTTEYYTCADNYWYLNNWSNVHKEHYTIEVFSHNIKANSLHFIENNMVPIARYIKAKLINNHEQIKPTKTHY